MTAVRPLFTIFLLGCSVLSGAGQYRAPDYTHVTYQYDHANSSGPVGANWPSPCEETSPGAFAGCWAEAVAASAGSCGPGQTSYSGFSPQDPIDGGPDDGTVLSITIDYEHDF
jgi:hypothetical protein